MVDSIIIHEYEKVISHIRELLNEQEMTQKELGERAGIDASHVSKSLNNERKASYEKIHRMWEILNKERTKKDKTSADDVMVSDIEWAHPEDTVQEVGEVAWENAYTQIPVKEQGDHIGWITTEQLAENEGDSPIRPLVHDEGFTSVPPYLDAETIQGYLYDDYRAVLVEDEGEYLGIITSYDLMANALDVDD